MSFNRNSDGKVSLKWQRIPETTMDTYDSLLCVQILNGSSLNLTPPHSMCDPFMNFKIHEKIVCFLSRSELGVPVARGAWIVTEYRIHFIFPTLETSHTMTKFLP